MQLSPLLLTLTLTLTSSLGANDVDPCGDEPSALPVMWLEVPGAPVVGVLRTTGGGIKAGLQNRTEKGVRTCSVGFAIIESGRVHVVHEVASVDVTHGAIPAGEFIAHLLPNDACTRGAWVEERRAIRSERVYTVATSVAFDDDTNWSAEGVQLVLNAEVQPN